MAEPDRAGADEPRVQVPDDARELALEAQALRRERASAARRDRIRRITALPRRDPRAATLLVVLLALAVVAAGALFTRLGPTRLAAPGPARLADGSGRPTGGEGALLPDLSLTPLPDDARSPSSQPEPVPLRSLRPAVVVLVPIGCSCPEPVRLTADIARAFAVRLVVVSPSVAELQALREPAGGSAAALLPDPDDQVPATAGRGGASGTSAAVLVVAPDGVVTGVEQDPTTTASLVPALQRALHPA